VGVSVSPQIPFINEDMERVLDSAAQAGATRAFYQVLRLPWELAPIFRQWLAQHYPQRAERVMARVQDLHGGRDYRADFATRMKGQGVWSELLRQRFDKTCHRLGLNRERVPLDSSRFRPRRPRRTAIAVLAIRCRVDPGRIRPRDTPAIAEHRCASDARPRSSPPRHSRCSHGRSRWSAREEAVAGSGPGPDGVHAGRVLSGG